MRKYDKIETLFIRDTEGTKKLIEGHYRNKYVSFLYIKSRPKSMLSEDARFEGIVGRPLVELKDARGQRIIVKIKVVDFA